MEQNKNTFLLFNVPQGFEHVALEEIFEKIPELKSLEYIIPPLYGLIYIKQCQKLTAKMIIQFKNLQSVDNIFVGVAEYDVDLSERNKLPKEEKYKFIEDALYGGDWHHALNVWHYCTENHINSLTYEDFNNKSIDKNDKDYHEQKKVKINSSDNSRIENNITNNNTLQNNNNENLNLNDFIPKILESQNQNLLDIEKNNYFKTNLENSDKREITFRGTFLKYDYKSKEIRTQQLASFIGDATFKKYMEENGKKLFKGNLKVNLKQWDLEIWGAFIKQKNWSIGEKDKHNNIAGVQELSGEPLKEDNEKKDTTNCSVNTSTYDKYKILYGITLPLNNYVNNDKSINHRNRCKFGRTSLRPTVAYCISRFSNIKPGMVVVDPCCGVGTIPIEASCICPTAMYYGGDIDQDEINDCALENIKYMTKLTGKRPPIDIFIWNCKKIPFGDNSIDRIVTDLPWGFRELSYVENRRLYPPLFRELMRVIKPDGLIVLMTSQRKLVRQILAYAWCKLDLLYFTEVVVGYTVGLYVFKKSV
jgi:tRNA G10  N-methylase Trm11